MIRHMVLSVSLTAWTAATGGIVSSLPALAAEPIAITARDTVTAVEMDHGDELRFTLCSGRTVSMILEDTEAVIVERVEPGGIIYRFACHVRIDGQRLTLQRFVCAQECFYEPYVVDGLRIWPDTVKAVFDVVPVRYPQEGNLRCRPRKAARFALQDAALRVCPQETHPWLDEPQNFLDVGRCYNGDDCYLGPYLGQACHVGMDINHRAGSPLLAPIDFDTQAWFNSLTMGHNNNRWRGIRRWPNGDVWALQTHHLIKLLVPENTPLQIGTRYATTAGVHVGSHEHTHFEFKVGRKNDERPLPASDDPVSIACPIDFDDHSEAAQNDPEVLHLDPWVLFWQIFEDRKMRQGELRAAIQPLAPARTGEPVTFSAEAARSSGADGAAVDDDARRSECAAAEVLQGHGLAARHRPGRSRDERQRMRQRWDWPAIHIGHRGRPRSKRRLVARRQRQHGVLPSRTGYRDVLRPRRDVPTIVDDQRYGKHTGTGEHMPRGLAYRAASVAEVTVDDRDEGFFATPYFWVGHRFSRCPPRRRGHDGFYLTNGNRAVSGEFARFTPDLLAGTYRVSFSGATPFPPDSEFDVRVRHVGGETTVRVRPETSRQIGRFEFAAGTDGFVEIQAAGSRGLMIADAVTFAQD